MQRILVSFEVELDCIDHKFLELDHADEHNGILRTLPFDRHKFLARRCGGEIDQEQKQQPRNKATEQLSRPPTAPERQIQQTTQNQQTQLTKTPIQQSQNVVSSTNNHTSRNTGHREERAHLMDNARAIFKEYRTSGPLSLRILLLIDESLREISDFLTINFGRPTFRSLHRHEKRLPVHAACLPQTAPRTLPSHHQGSATEQGRAPVPLGARRLCQH